MPERNNEYVYQPPAKFIEELRQRINNAGFSDEFKQQIKSAQAALSDTPRNKEGGKTK